MARITPRAVDTGSSPSRPSRILVVEDDESLALFYRTALQPLGCDITTVVDGLDALCRVESERPDLVILDIDLPRVSGVDVQQELAAHEDTRDIPVLVATGNDAVALPVPCQLRKPVDAETLLDAVRTCLKNRS